MVGHDGEAPNRLDAIPCLVEGHDDVDEQPGNPVSLKVVASRVAADARKRRIAIVAPNGDHIETW